jgi:hypothetical protein
MLIAKLYRVGGWDSATNKRVLTSTQKSKEFKNRQQVDSENKNLNTVGGKGSLLWVPVKDLEKFEVR